MGKAIYCAEDATLTIKKPHSKKKKKKKNGTATPGREHFPLNLEATA